MPGFVLLNQNTSSYLKEINCIDPEQYFRTDVRFKLPKG